MEPLMNSGTDLLSQILDTLLLLKIFNLAIAAFGALLLFRMKTETSTEHAWARHLAIALVIFALQYLAFTFRMDETPIVGVVNPLFWSELFGLPINLLLMSSASILLNRRKWWPSWFLALILIDCTGVILTFLLVGTVKTTDPILTLCRVAGDMISFVTLMNFGYASYINTKFYKHRFGLVLGVVIGIVYGGIHLVSPFIPNIAAWYSPLNEDVTKNAITAGFTFVAALFKLAVLYSAILIMTLENEALIQLHTKLRESVVDRIVFFSRDGIFKAIVHVFRGTAVRLYIKIPVKAEEEKPLVHVYFSEKGPEYESTDESNTPIPKLLEELTKGSTTAPRPAKRLNAIPLLNRMWREKRAREQRAPFAGIAPIRYHGGLIGCLEIKKVSGQHFTYSEERLSMTLSKDIAALVQFYRVQESLRVLIEGLDIKIEPLSIEGPAEIFSHSLNRRFEKVIQCVLSPLKTSFIVDAGFVSRHSPAAHNGESNVQTLVLKTISYDCVTDEVRGEMMIGRICLDYQRGRDPLDRPSLGYFSAHGKTVASILTRSFLDQVEYKFNLIIRNLTFKLTKKLNFDTWFDEVQASVSEAELEGAVVYHPEIRNFSKFVRDNDAPRNKEIGSALAAAYPSPRELLQQLDTAPRRVVGVNRLIVGIKMKLDAGDAALFVGISRSDFATELELETPWRNFLINLASVAGSALERVIYARNIQRNQIKQTEDYMVLSTAEKVGLITHELLSHIENLSNNSGLLKLDLPKTLDEALRKPIEARIEEMRKEFTELRSLTGLIRRSAQIPEQSGPSSLNQTLQKLALLHESGSNVRIMIEGIKDRSNGFKPLDDVTVNLPADIVELTIGNLIRNSMAAIKRKAPEEKDGSFNLPCQGLIRIWVEVNDEERMLDCFINDNGCGIPPSMKEKIFDVNVSSTPGQGGWGLFYVKRKLGRNGGSVNVEHSEPNNTTFRVRLPLFMDKAT